MSIVEDNSSRTALNSQKPIGDEFGQGEIIVEKINAQNTSKKFSSFISKGSQEVNIDGTVFLKSAKGDIVISGKEIFCGNVKYPFEEILGIVRSGNNLIKSVDVTLESKIKNKRYHIELEIISENSDKIFSKLTRISMKPERDLTRHTVKRQGKFLKERFGLRRNSR